MATCKDCLHVDVCEDITRHKLSPSRAKEILPFLREHGKTCEQFKDRSRFVELPCKVYTTHLGRVAEAKICGYEASMKSSNYSLIIEPQHFGKYVFFTREEAEQALAKQNQPDNTPQ